MQFIVQSEIKLSSVECHIHLGAAGSAVALHIFGFSFAHPLLFLSLECVRNTSSSTQCRVEALWERRCLCFCGSSRVMVLVQRSSEWWVGRGRSRVGTGTAIFTCTLNLLLSGFEISAHLCFWLLNRAEWKGAFLLKKRILEWVNMFTRVSMGLFGDWAKTACGVKVALHTNTTHRFNFRCHLWNQFFVPIPFFGQESVSSIHWIYG